MVHTWERLITSFWCDRRGQDLIEYAMLAAFLAVAVGAVFPSDIAPNISRVFSKVTSMMDASGAFG
ncbi:MAG: Flp family type IVb pilin [Acidobacteria bacterium]|nr:Flp family type IVb pilin [Acidobacteriota bacterium]